MPFHKESLKARWISARLVDWAPVLVVLVAYALHLAWQVRALRLDDPALALRLFRSNREAGVILLIAIALGAFHFV